MKTTFNQHIGVFEDAIPFNICDNIISTFETNPDKTFTRLEKNQLLLFIKRIDF
jgi:hypothetical protein